MKKTIFAAAVCSALATPMVHAQAQHFEGMDISLGITVSQTTSEVVSSLASRSASATDNNMALQLQYNWPLGDSFLLGLGGTVGLGDQKSGDFGNVSAKVKDAYSLYLAPGYAFNETWMGYGKLAFLNANLQLSNGKSQGFDNGVGYGIGVQAAFDKHWYGQVEYMVNRYQDRSPSSFETVKLKSDVYTLSAGYRF